jgi:hypothetical protein
MLPDSRAASNIIVGKSARKLKVKKESKTDWDTPAGKFATDGRAKIHLQLLQFLSPIAETNYVWCMFMLENPELRHDLRVRHSKQVRTRHLF